MTTTLIRGGRIRTGTLDRPDWVLVEDQTIAGIGSEAPEPLADRVFDLDGAVLVPAFCDAHVHLPATGLYAAGMDFRGQRSARRILDSFSERTADGEAILFGGNFEDPLDAPILATDLDEAVGGRAALLMRADMHSCVASTELVRALDLNDVEGVDRDETGAPTGYLRERGAALAWRWFEASLPPAQVTRALEAAVDLALAKGICSVHEMFVQEWRGWDSLSGFLAFVERAPLEVVTYVATTDIGRVTDLGLTRIGGDLFLDGSFGSHTAWMKDPYVDSPPSGSSATGVSYRSDEELREFFGEAQRSDLQTGVHAIGDAAVEQALTAWEAVAAQAGIEAVRALGHRIEHFECATDDHIERAARLGLRASVQPAFDAFWGGEDRLYARRIGVPRALQMNRFASMARAGLVVGAGSDSTVTPLDPFLQMSALRAHHLPDERMSAAEALAAHTVGAHELAGREKGAGTIEVGKLAHLAVLDRDPLEVDEHELTKTEVLETWVAGERVWPTTESERR